MPTGKVRWFDAAKGFGFLASDEGADVFVHADALPAGVETLKQGQRVEFGIVQGRRGDQALQVRLVESAATGRKGGGKPTPAKRKTPEQMTVIVEDLIRMLDDLGEGYRHGRHPDPKKIKPVAQVLRALASELD
ncbi:MAG: cold-shock protein [Aeromicrobium sp.]|uniref:cold-shock protein n=1 Tax=Aeromicrobium sp. TaxID=1871063 RepID=UPI0039E3B489